MCGRGGARVGHRQLPLQGDTASVKILAKQLVQSRKAKERLYQSKAQMNSVSMQIQAQYCASPAGPQSVGELTLLRAGASPGHSHVQNGGRDAAEHGGDASDEPVRPPPPSVPALPSHRGAPRLVRVPEVAATMQALAREMERAGLIEEMMDDAFEEVEGDEVEVRVREGGGGATLVAQSFRPIPFAGGG